MNTATVSVINLETGPFTANPTIRLQGASGRVYGTAKRQSVRLNGKLAMAHVCRMTPEKWEEAAADVYGVIHLPQQKWIAVIESERPKGIPEIKLPDHLGILLDELKPDMHANKMRKIAHDYGIDVCGVSGGENVYNAVIAKFCMMKHDQQEEPELCQ